MMVPQQVTPLPEPSVPVPVPDSNPVDPLIQFRQKCGLSTGEIWHERIKLFSGISITVVCTFLLSVITRAHFLVFVALLGFTSLGIYLALAAHRRLQYHSHIRLVSYLAGLIRDYPPERRS